MMGTKGSAKDAAKLSPLAVAVPSKQGIVLMSHDFLSGAMHSRPEMPLCPAYRLCKEMRGPYRLPMVDSSHDQQITILHDLLRAIKEAALKLIQLITIDIEKRWKRDTKRTDFPMRYSDPRYQKRKQPTSPGSGLIAATSSSVCALCGVTLHSKDSSKASSKKSSKEARQFAIDKARIDEYNVSPKNLDNILFEMLHKIPSSIEKESSSADKRAKRQKDVSSEIKSTDMSESSLKSILFLVRQISSDEATSRNHVRQKQTHQDGSQRKFFSASQMPKFVTNKEKHKIDSHQCIINVSPTISSVQDSSTLTQEVLCPCACGLLVKDEIKNGVATDPTPTLKDKVIKTKPEELGFRLDSQEIAHLKAHDDTVKAKEAKTQKLEDDESINVWTEEIMQLLLQMQIEELHKNIQYFKQENAYIRNFAEKCRCLSKDTGGLQLLPIREAYFGFTTMMKYLQIKYQNEYGIVSKLTGIFRGSINIQQIATRLLASFFEHWSPKDNVITTHISTSTESPSRPASSMVFDVY